MEVFEFSGVVVICSIAAAILVLVVILMYSVRVVREFERLVVFRFGKVREARGPGWIIVIPFVEEAVKVDLREQVREIPHQTSITKDNAAISVDFIWYYKVLDPILSVVAVRNLEESAEGMATTTLRAVIGGILLDDVLSERDHINDLLRTRLDEVTERWGVKVTNVEIREIVPPREILDAMNRQMSAERERRAQVTQSTGEKEAAINIADGQKQAAILEADGQRQSAILRAKGYAESLELIFKAAAAIDQKTMTLQYFDTLKELGQGEATKFIFPMEFTSMMESFIDGKKKTGK
jgi:regulator of protease activity HflC (stomatin/prohibitin superfamily)